MYDKYAKRRDELGMTDYRVAKISGVLTSTLSEWKKFYLTDGKEGYQPKIKKLSAISAAIGMDLTELIN